MWPYTEEELDSFIESFDEQILSLENLIKQCPNQSFEHPSATKIGVMTGSADLQSSSY